MSDRLAVVLQTVAQILVLVPQLIELPVVQIAFPKHRYAM